jgi:hypothetical protein
MTFSRVAVACAALVFCLQAPAHSFSFPQLFWPQKDIDSSSVNDTAMHKKVLIASRKSVFKLEVIEKIKETFAGESVYVKCVGMKQLAQENTAGYQAIVLISTCMAWDFDRHIHSFLKTFKDTATVVILTTSGKGTWLPKHCACDAVACASKKKSFDTACGELILKIRKRLEAR